jgi:hypothetical protein
MKYHKESDLREVPLQMLVDERFPEGRRGEIHVLHDEYVDEIYRFKDDLFSNSAFAIANVLQREDPEYGLHQVLRVDIEEADFISVLHEQGAHIEQLLRRAIIHSTLENDVTIAPWACA